LAESFGFEGLIRYLGSKAARSKYKMFAEINKSQEKPTTKNKPTNPSPLLKGGGSEADGGLPTGAAGPKSLPE